MSFFGCLKLDKVLKLNVSYAPNHELGHPVCLRHVSDPRWRFGNLLFSHYGSYRGTYS